MTTVTCICGKTSLKFAAEPGVVAECGCCDCRQKVRWAAAQAGRDWKPTLLTLNYVVDDVVGVTGAENLRMVQLRNDGAEFITAVCCYSVLAVPAGYYNGQFVAVFAQGCKLECKAPTPTIRYSASDFPGPLPPYEGENIAVALHPSKYRGANPAGTTAEQTGVNAWVKHLRASAVREGHGPGKFGETSRALMTRLHGSSATKVLGLTPLEPGIE